MDDKAAFSEAAKLRLLRGQVELGALVRRFRATETQVSGFGTAAS